MNKTKKEEYKNFFQKNKAQDQQQTYATKRPNFAKQSKQSVSGKPFKSSYINDSGKWSIKAVDDGYVDFDDYINDIKDESATYPSYNNKNFRVSDYEIKQAEDNYEYKSKMPAQEREYAAIIGEEGKFKWVLDDVKERVEDFKEKENNDIIEFALDKYEEQPTVLGSGVWAARNLGTTVATKGYQHATTSDENAYVKAAEWGLDGAHNNKADAYRHFIWNALMTRDSDVGYYQARNVTNRHEYENMRDSNWLDKNSGSFDFKKDNAIIKGKMNRENLMDLWNNQVGRELANNEDFKDMTEEDLFEYAIENNYLITNADDVFDFLGINDYVVDKKVDVEWNLTSGNVTVKKDNKSVTLKIGV